MAGKIRLGDIVEVTATPYWGYPYFKIGDRALIFRKDEDGDLWGNFSINKDFVDDGEWCLQKSIGTRYKLVYSSNAA